MLRTRKSHQTSSQSVCASVLVCMCVCECVEPGRYSVACLPAAQSGNACHKALLLQISWKQLAKFPIAAPCHMQHATCTMRQPRNHRATICPPQHDPKLQFANNIYRILPSARLLLFVFATSFAVQHWPHSLGLIGCCLACNQSLSCRKCRVLSVQGLRMGGVNNQQQALSDRHSAVP